MIPLQNAKQLPKRYFGLHMCEGVAEYKEVGKDPYRVFLNQDTIMHMNKSFEGKPVFVQHVDEINMATVQHEADGWVVKSFYNQADGKHWVEFIVVSDLGHEKLKQGWMLSNAYLPKSMVNGGEWHGVPYQHEITSAEYDHLAIVPNPRYSESIILTPDEFEKYNNDKHTQIKKIANSKEKGESKMLKFFKREKIENSLDIEQTMVQLPKSKREVTIGQLVNEADEKATSKMCNMDDELMFENEKMTVEQLVEKLKAVLAEVEEMKAAPKDEPKPEEIKPEDKKENLDDEEAKKKALELAKHEEDEIEAAKKKENEEKKEEGKKNFESLKNAKDEAIKAPQQTIRVELSEDRVARGKNRYGSN